MLLSNALLQCRAVRRQPWASTSMTPSLVATSRWLSASPPHVIPRCANAAAARSRLARYAAAREVLGPEHAPHSVPRARRPRCRRWSGMVNADGDAAGGALFSQQLKLCLLTDRPRVYPAFVSSPVCHASVINTTHESARAEEPGLQLANSAENRAVDTHTTHSLCNQLRQMKHYSSEVRLKAANP